MTSIVDTFNRADSATALGTTSDGHGTWVAQLGTWGISANKAYQPGAGGDVIATVDAAIADCTVQVTLATINPAIDGASGIVFRYSSNTNWFAFRTEGPGTVYRLVSIVAGTFSTLGTGAATPASGDVAKVVMSGTSIKAYINGVQQISVTNSSLTTNTKHGLYSASSDTVSRWDDFSVAAPVGGTPRRAFVLSRQAVVRASVR